MIQKLLRNNILLFTILFLVTITLSCNFDKGLTTSEQAKLDDSLLVQYLISHKLDTLDSSPETNINWVITEAVEGDSTLMDILDSAIVYTSGGIEYTYYYIEIESGKSPKGSTSDLMVADYNEYLLDGTLISTSNDMEDAIALEIDTRIKGIQLAVDYEQFYTGIVSDTLKTYRTETDTPGRAIFLFPSGLGYYDIGNDAIAPYQPLRIDLVLYTRIDFDE